MRGACRDDIATAAIVAAAVIRQADVGVVHQIIDAIVLPFVFGVGGVDGIDPVATGDRVESIATLEVVVAVAAVEAVVAGFAHHAVVVTAAVHAVVAFAASHRVI